MKIYKCKNVVEQYELMERVAKSDKYDFVYCCTFNSRRHSYGVISEYDIPQHFEEYPCIALGTYRDKPLILCYTNHIYENTPYTEKHENKESFLKELFYKLEPVKIMKKHLLTK